MRKFKASSLRLVRATEHLAAFQAEWNRLAKNRWDSIVRYDKDSGWYIASLTPEDSVLDSIRNTPLPLIVGEFAYQLRASLDGLMWDAITVMQNGAEPPVDAKDVYFPILSIKNAKFDECGFNRFPFPNKLKAWLKAIQLNSTQKPLDYPEGLIEALEDINNLSRIDRHRRLRIIASMPTELYAEFETVPKDGFTIVGQEGLPCNILGDEYDLLRFKVESVTGNQPEKIRIITCSKFEVFFEDIPPVKDAPSGTRLGQLCDAVGYVIDRFESEFA
jgi:hypothetical protein